MLKAIPAMISNEYQQISYFLPVLSICVLWRGFYFGVYRFVCFVSVIGRMCLCKRIDEQCVNLGQEASSSTARRFRHRMKSAASACCVVFNGEREGRGSGHGTACEVLLSWRQCCVGSVFVGEGRGEGNGAAATCRAELPGPFCRVGRVCGSGASASTARTDRLREAAGTVHSPCNGAAALPAIFRFVSARAPFLGRTGFADGNARSPERESRRGRLDSTRHGAVCRQRRRSMRAERRTGPYLTQITDLHTHAADSRPAAPLLH